MFKKSLLIFCGLLAICRGLAASEDHAVSQRNDTPDWEAYEQGKVGSRPRRRFRSSSATPPLVNVVSSNDRCDSNGYVFLSPQDSQLPGNRAWMMDHKGHLVWAHEEWGSVKNLQVQTYKGRQYLTFWVGDDGFWGHGSGFYKMLDPNYALAYVLRAENDLDGDYHEFSITPDDTALITAYTKVPWDLTSRGRENGFIWDCVFQELDVTTNRLLFEWRASEHLNFEDMAVDSWTDWTGTEDDPWDWFHLNSVEKDVQGNYLISARYTNAITYISGQGGDVLWNLGGKNGDFTDLAEGNATHIVDPHMARWADNGTAITFFDNIAFWSYEKDKQQTHAIKIALNLETHVAKSLAEFVHPKGIFAESEGSIQHLDSGNYLVGYGSAPVYTEFSAHGEFLCDTHYAPLQAEKATLMGLPRHAYRTYKHHWVGFPEEPPKVKLEGQQLFVSWNGATEVRSWKLDGRKLPRNSWSSLGTYAKDDFEVAMKLQKSKFPDYRITAIDGHGSPLGAWFVHKDGRLTELYKDSIQQHHHSSHRRPFVWALLCSSFSLLMLLNRRLFMRG